MSDSDAKLKVTADTTGAVGPVDKLTEAEQRAAEAAKKAGKEFDDAIQPLPASYLKASAAVNSFGVQAEKGGKGAEKALAFATIQVQQLEAEIAGIKAQGKPTADLEAGLDTLKGKLTASTATVGQFRAAQADAADATRRSTIRQGEFSGSISDVTGTLKNMSPVLADAIDKYSILAAKAFAVAQAASLVTAGLRAATDGAAKNKDGVAQVETATRAYIVASDDLLKSITRLDIKGTAAGVLNLAGTWRAHAEGLYENVTAFGALTDAKRAYDLASTIKVQREIVAGHEAELNALNNKAAALIREVAVQKEAGGIQKFVRTEIKETLDAYVAADEPINAALAATAKSLGIVSTAQEAASKTAKDLAKDALESATKRAKAEEEAADKIRKAHEAVLSGLRTQYKSLYDEIAAIEARLAGGATDKANARAAELEATVKRLGSEPSLAEKDRSELDAAKDELSRLKTANRSSFPGARNPETDAQIADIELLQQKNFELNQVNQQGQKVYDILAQSQTKANDQIVVGTGAVAQGEDAWTAYHKAAAASIAATDAAAGSQAALGDAAS